MLYNIINEFEENYEVIMENIKELKEKFINLTPNQWDAIPDIDLYMDQVITYMQRQHIGLDDRETLTPAMINNYIKSELLPRAKGKRYSREHIAYLTAICLLKQVLSVGDTGALLHDQLENKDIKDFYNNYSTTLNKEFKKVSDQIDEDYSEEQLSQLAMQLAISSYAEKLACEKILDILTKGKDKG
ncbi:MAG: DUF1836 domain-containing protein [Anaerovoracaceae bacterium]